MIMEYVEGMNLRDFMKLRTRIPTEQAGPLMLGMAQGLKYSLERGVTHRDIKGTNILISNQGEAKLVDFGLATMQGEETKPGVKSQRTVDYSALERTCNSPKGDPRSDIYFLGCVFYQMLTGQLPMEEIESKDMLRKMLKRSFGAIKPINEHRYAPDEELGGIIEKMMKIDLKARYQTMNEVVVELERYMADLEAAKAGGRVKTKAEDDEAFVESIFLPRDFEQIPDQHPAAAPVHKPVPSKSILCVETQTEIRDAFRKTLSSMGYKVLLVSDAEVAAERFRESPADAVIFDTDGQDEESIEAFLDMHEKAHEEGHQLVALVLLGAKQEALKEQLPADDKLIVFSKPIKMKQVQDALEKLVPIH
jgi:serine/threonine protein kinase